jgi:hypothetical protein
VIHGVDLGELFGGGETHAYTVLKRAALSIIPRSQSMFQTLLHLFACL